MKKSYLNLISLIISASYFFIIPLILQEMPTYQAHTIALALMAFTLWLTEAIPLFVTSLIILFVEIAVLYPQMKEAKIAISKQDFMAPFSSNIIFLFFGGLLLAEAITKYGIDKLLAKKMAALSKSPSTLLLIMMTVTAFLSMWMSNTATTAMMLIMVTPLTRTLKDKVNFEKAFYLGIPFAANLGGMGTPVGTPPNAIAIEQINKVSSTYFSFLDWIIAALPLVSIALVLLWIVLIKVFKMPDEQVIYSEEIAVGMNKKSWAIIVLFILTAILWLSSKLHGIPSGIVALVPAIFFFSSGILKKQDLRRISWDILYLVGGGISLAVALKTSGVTDKIVASLDISQLTSFTLCSLFVLLGSLMTSFMSNTATANILIPLVFLIPSNDTLSIALAVAMAISSTMIFPVSTPPNVIAYSSGKIRMVDMVKVGLFVTVFLGVSIILFGKIWWKFLGVI